MNPFRRHRHAPEIVSVGHYEYVLFSSPVTVVLYRCVECGKTWTANTDGWWSKEELAVKP